VMGWFFTLAGIMGALLVASNSGHAVIGYSLFFINGVYNLWSLWGDLKQRCLWAVFGAVNLYGLYNFF
jgi:hypothetical protein